MDPTNSRQVAETFPSGNTTQRCHRFVGMPALRRASLAYEAGEGDGGTCDVIYSTSTPRSTGRIPSRAVERGVSNSGLEPVNLVSLLSSLHL